MSMGKATVLKTLEWERDMIERRLGALAFEPVDILEGRWYRNEYDAKTDRKRLAERLERDIEMYNEAITNTEAYWYHAGDESDTTDVVDKRAMDLHFIAAALGVEDAA